MNRQKLLSVLNIRPGEGWLVGWMLVYAFLMGVPALITETAAYSLFLVEFDAQSIPYVYIGFAIITTLSGFVYTSLERRISFSKFATINLVILTLVLYLFRFILWFTDAAWPVAGLAIWYETSWALSNLGFWSLAVRLFNIRQGKRLFGLIGIGLTLSESIIGFFIPTMVRWMGTANLLLLAAMSFTGALIVQTYIMHAYIARFSASEEEEDDDGNENQAFVTDLFKNRYIVLIFALAALYALSFYALDNAFYDRLEVQFPDADQLASFLGIFFGLSGLLTMIMGAFISGKLITRYGLDFGLMVMPVTILIGTILIIVFGTAFKALVVLFWVVVITKLINEVLAYTINRAAWQVLYEPLPASQRLRAQTVVESIIKPVAGGLAGVLLLGLGTLFVLGTIQIAYLLLVILILWIVVVVFLNRAYPVMLMQALTKRRLRDTALFVADKTSVAILKRALNNTHPGVVIYALNMLERIDPESFPSFLQNLLKHPSPEIRLEVLRRVERQKIKEALPAIQQQVDYEVYPSVRGIALQVLAILGNEEMVQMVANYVDDPNPQVRLGALAGLLCSQEKKEDPTLFVDKKLDQLVQSPQSADRAFAAQVFGEAGIQKFSPVLLKLLQDDKLKVQQAALVAAKKLHGPELWPKIIEYLASPKVRVDAMSALVASGEAVLPALQQKFASKKRQNPEVLIRLARVCGRIGGAKSVALLQENLTFPDARVRYHILMALSQCEYQAVDSQVVEIIEQGIKDEISHAAWVLSVIDHWGDDETFVLLNSALEGCIAQCRARIFLLLSFIYDTQAILQARDTLGISDAPTDQVWDQKRAYALEIIDVTLSLDLKVILLPLLDDLTARERLRRLNLIFPQPDLDQIQYLKDIITGPTTWLNPWTKACALYTAAQLSAQELTEAAVWALTNPDILVKETAIWTLCKLDPELYHHYISQLVQDPDPQVAKVISWLEAEQNGDSFMLSLVEKVILLKTVSFFAETPEEVLAEVAAVLEELKVKAGETIIEKGEPGDTLYIIVEGQVRIHDDARTIATLNPSDVFGEFSILDPGPRSASVTALEDTHLFRLDQDPFFELIDDHSTVARRIMQILVRYLRHAQAQVRQSKEEWMGEAWHRPTPV